MNLNPAPSSYEAYWRLVLGSRSAEQVVSEFDLDEAGVSEWLSSAEEAAGVEDGEYYAKAIAELTDALDDLAASEAE